jgi:hypothetical protein
VESRGPAIGCASLMNPNGSPRAGQDRAGRVLTEPGGPKAAIAQRCSRIVLADLCATSAPEIGTNRYQRDVA